MPRPEDLDRTLELPAEALDDLDPLESTTAGPVVPHPARTRTVARPLSPGDSQDAFTEVYDSIEQPASQQVAIRRMAIARREQRHRHALELEEQRERHRRIRQRMQQETRLMGAVLLLVVASGLAWIAMPVVDAAQIVFTTSFGVAAGYLGGRSRRGDSRAG